MEIRMQGKLVMEMRLGDFTVAHPFDDGPASELAARYREKVARQQLLVDVQRHGEKGRKAQVVRAKEVRKEMSAVPLRHLAALAPSLRSERPDLAALIGQPASRFTAVEFRSAVHAILAGIQAEHDVLRAKGMSEETIPTLTRLVAEYEAAISNTNAERRAHVGARAEMKQLDRELMQLARQLDGMVAIHFRDQPDLLAAWKSARNVAWPVIERPVPAVKQLPPGPAAG